MNLIIYAELFQKDSDIIPIFFINLDKDTQRKENITALWTPISEHVHRIPGVSHSLGLEGCRLAHINANIEAVNSGHKYYIISEDDLLKLQPDSDIKHYIQNVITTKPELDLVLFEQGQNLESRMALQKINENLYQIFSGGNNTGCYLCSHNFGLQLIKFWLVQPEMDIDQTWQKLWPSNKIYFHRPQLFHQSAGWSNQNDIGYRDETRPFNWEEYERLH
jgi:hypothetical protein